MPGSVEVWETAFADEFVRPVTQDARPQSVLAVLTRKERKRKRAPPESAPGLSRCEIEETEFVMTQEYRAEWRPRLLRDTWPPKSFAHFHATFLLDSE